MQMSTISHDDAIKIYHSQWEKSLDCYCSQYKVNEGLMKKWLDKDYESRFMIDTVLLMARDVVNIKEQIYMRPIDINNKIHKRGDVEIIVFIDGDNNIININELMWVFINKKMPPIEFVIITSKDYTNKMTRHIDTNYISIISSNSSSHDSVMTVMSMIVTILHLTSDKSKTFILIGNNESVLELKQQIGTYRQCHVIDINEINLAPSIIRCTDCMYLSPEANIIKHWFHDCPIYDTFHNVQRKIESSYGSMKTPLDINDILPCLNVISPLISTEIIFKQLIDIGKPSQYGLDSLKETLKIRGELSFDDSEIQCLIQNKKYSDRILTGSYQNNLQSRSILDLYEVKLYLSADIVSKKYNHNVLRYNPQFVIDIEDALRALFRLRWFGSVLYFCERYNVGFELFRSWLDKHTSYKCVCVMKLFLEDISGGV